MENEEIKRRILDLELKLSGLEKTLAEKASNDGGEDFKKMRGQIETLERSIADLGAKLTTPPSSAKKDNEDDPFDF